MRDLSNLSPSPGSSKNRNRRGRGYGSGNGRYGGRGLNGAQSRSGFKRRAWFEGGQMPIQRRLPKRGFTNIFREEMQEINLRDLARIDGGIAEISTLVLAEQGLIKRADRPVKLLGEGEFDRKVTIHVTAASASARQRIEALGGTVVVPEPAPAKRGKYKKRAERGE